MRLPTSETTHLIGEEPGVRPLAPAASAEGWGRQLLPSAYAGSGLRQSAWLSAMTAFL
jgi:hypothetical protein